MQERRADIRMLCADVVDVWWTDPSGSRHQDSALLEDISAAGACLQFEHAVPEGSTLHFLCAGVELEGRTRYCVYHEIGYFVGVGFAGSHRGSLRHIKPRHLLDLSRFLK